MDIPQPNLPTYYYYYGSTDKYQHNSTTVPPATTRAIADCCLHGILPNTSISNHYYHNYNYGYHYYYHYNYNYDPMGNSPCPNISPNPGPRAAPFPTTSPAAGSLRTPNCPDNVSPTSPSWTRALDHALAAPGGRLPNMVYFSPTPVCGLF